MGRLGAPTRRERIFREYMKEKIEELKILLFREYMRKGKVKKTMGIKIKNIIDSYEDYYLVECEDGSICSIDKENHNAYIDYIRNLINGTELNNDELIKKIKMINKIPDKGYMIGYQRMYTAGIEYLRIYKIYSNGEVIEWI